MRSTKKQSTKTQSTKKQSKRTPQKPERRSDQKPDRKPTKRPSNKLPKNQKPTRRIVPQEEFDSESVNPQISSGPTGDYALLDSGNMKKLERVGEYKLIRPSPQAIWEPTLSLSDWHRADAVYERDASGAGQWTWNKRINREFDVLFSELVFRIKLTNFGHMGLFAEQAPNWAWMRKIIRARMLRTNDRNLHVLNLFGYTGGSTLAASQAGAHLVHVDAAKGAVDWARVNAKTCRLNDRPIRWLVDDAMKFVQREERRGTRYQGIILDPPSFGRGPKGEVFKIEKDLIPLLQACKGLLASDALFVLYSCHTPGFTPTTLSNQLDSVIGKREGTRDCGEMTIPDEKGRQLPSGVYARWMAKE